MLLFGVVRKERLIEVGGALGSGEREVVDCLCCSIVMSVQGWRLGIVVASFLKARAAKGWYIAAAGGATERRRSKRCVNEVILLLAR